jgi:hypothetical protein
LPLHGVLVGEQRWILSWDDPGFPVFKAADGKYHDHQKKLIHHIYVGNGDFEKKKDYT